MSKDSTGRPKRTPIGTKNVLTYPKKEGYVRRVVNDEEGRINQFEGAGYSVVREHLDAGDPKAGKASQVGSAVHPHVGGGKKAVLMEIRKDWHDEDQKTKQNQILMDENDMKRKLNSPSEGMYGGVKIS